MRITYDHLIQARREIPIQPVRQRSLFDHQLSRARHRLDNLDQFGNRRGFMPRGFLPARVVDISAFTKRAVHIQRDVVRASHGCLLAELETASDLWPRTSYSFNRTFSAF